MKHLVIAFPMILCFITSCHHNATRIELEKLKSQNELEELNKEIVSEVFEAIDANDFEKIEMLIADNFSLNAPGLEQPWKKENLFEGIRTFYSAFPDWTHNIENILAEGDIVMVKIMMKGTQKADYEGISATEKQITMAAAAQMALVDGKVKDWWAIEDYLGFYQQLGMELKMKEE